MPLPDFPAILKAIKQSARVLFTIACIALFLPQKYLALIGADELIATYREWIGVLFLVSLAFVLGDVFNWAKNQYSYMRRASYGKQRLRNLTPAEKDILRGYIEKNTRTQHLDFRSGVVNGLVDEDIIYMSSRMSVRMTFAYNIQPWAWNYLQKNKRLLK